MPVSPGGTMTPMNDSPTTSQSDGGSPQPLPPWSECDYFCIHDYAVTNAKPCGWRGRIPETRSEASGLQRLCPNCGQASLLRIPPRE